MPIVEDVFRIVDSINDDLPVIKLLEKVITQAVSYGSKTIFFLPEKNSLSVFSTDGKVIVMYEIDLLKRREGALFSALVSRAKVLSGMRISVRDTSQAAYFRETRSSLPPFTAVTIPTIFGEGVILTLNYD